MNIENFVNDYLQEHRHDVLLNPYNGLIDFTNAFKEQMMKEAVDADVELILHDKTGDVRLHTGYLPKELGIKCDDKVRVIIVKED